MALTWRIMYSAECNECGKKFIHSNGEEYFKGESLKAIKERMLKEGWIVKADFLLCPECNNNNKKENINVKDLLNLTQELTGLPVDKILNLLNKNVKIEK